MKDLFEIASTRLGGNEPAQFAKDGKRISNYEAMGIIIKECDEEGDIIYIPKRERELYKQFLDDQAGDM